MPPTRRDILLSTPLAATGRAARHPDDAARAPGLTVRMASPPNLEGPFADYNSFVTPVGQFYVRNHFPTPVIDAATYTLEVSGAVAKPLTLSLADIRALPAVTMPLTLECAGNGRVFLTPPARGLQWQFGAVGTAEWTGVRLSTILEAAGVQPAATEVILVGADKGLIGGDHPSPGAIPFDRSIPLAKAMKPEVLLAYAMNGKPLTAAHGFPLRAVVGGWFGMAAVKWLTRVVATATPYNGFWQTIDYAYYARRDGGLPTLQAVAEMLPKAQLARPAFGEVVPAGKAYPVRGFAWAGEQAVTAVELSTDGGTTWAAAKLIGDAKPMCWRAWEASWTPAAAGPAKLVARCTDAAGRGQPAARDADRRTYMINHLVPVEVTVQ